MVHQEPSGSEHCTRTGRHFVYICPDCHTHYIAPQPCMKLDCATCAGRVKARRGARHFQSLGGQAVLHWVLTFHGSWWHALSPARVHALRPLVAQLIQEWFKDVRNLEVGLLVSIHPTGSTCERCGAKHDTGELERTGACPDCGAPAPWRPHFDIIIPAAGVRSGDVALTFPPYIPEDVLLTFRDRWGDFCNRIADALKLERRPAQVWHGYQRRPEKVAHALSYSGRPFPAFYDAMPRSARSPQRYGLLAPGALRATGLRLRARELYRALVAGKLLEHPLRCAECGAELDLWGVVREGLALGELRRLVDLHDLGECPTGPPRYRGSSELPEEHLEWEQRRRPAWTAPAELLREQLASVHP